MEKGKKCPNCGYVATKNQDVCPNCDQFETQVFQPLTDEKIAELNDQKTQGEEVTPPVEEPKVSKEEEEVTIEEPKEISAEEAMSIIREVNEDSGDTEKNKGLEKVDPEGISDENPVEKEVEIPTSEKKEEVVIEKFERPQITEAREIVAEAEKEKVEQVASSISTEEKVLDPKASSKKELSQKGKRNRLIAFVLALVLLFGGGYFAYSKYSAKKEAELVASLKKEVASLTLDAEKLYFNEERVFLSKDFDKANLEKLKTDIKELDSKADKEELTDLVVDLEARAAKQDELNELFATPIILGDELIKDAYLKNSKAGVPAEIEPEKDGLDKLLNLGRKEVESQVSLNEKTEKLMSAIYTDKVNPKATQKMYDDAKASVDKLKDPTLKEKYEKGLKEVQASLKKAAEKKAKEEAEAEKQVNSTPQAQSQTQPATTNNNGAGINDGTEFGAGQGITTQANKNSINYVDVPEEGAWSWAPGVKEQVIAECIARGYMVEGGYVLRQKEVINGEGYYDLYATSTSSSLLKNRLAEELPIYLVTINAKTGWYQGEGPN